MDGDKSSKDLDDRQQTEDKIAWPKENKSEFEHVQNDNQQKLYVRGSNETFENRGARVQYNPDSEENKRASLLSRLLVIQRVAVHGSVEEIRECIRNSLPDSGEPSSSGIPMTTIATGYMNDRPIGMIVVVDALLWRKYSRLVEKDVRFYKLISFLLSGNTNGKFYAYRTSINIAELQFVDDMINDNCGKNIIDILCDITSHIDQNRVKPLVFVLVRCVLNKETKDTALERFSVICDTPPKFFEFVSICHTIKISERRNQQIRGTYDRRKNKNQLNRLERQQKTRALKYSSPESVTGSSSNISKVKIPTVTKQRVLSDKSSMLAKSEHSNVLEKPYKKLIVTAKVKQAAAKFYDDKSPAALLYFLTKYRQGEDGINHRDIIRYSHLKYKTPDSYIKNMITVFILKGYSKFGKEAIRFLEGKRIIAGVEKVVFSAIDTLHLISTLSAKIPENTDRLIQAWQEYAKRPTDKIEETRHYAETEHEYFSKSFHLVFQHIPPAFLKNSKLWDEIVEDLPYTTILQNLKQMTKTELFRNNPRSVKKVVDILTDKYRILEGKIHPLTILIALRRYQQSLNIKDYKDVVDIMRAMFEMFHNCLKDPSMKENFACNKKMMITLDIRHRRARSLNKCIGAEELSTMEAGLSLAMCMTNYEEQCEVYTFDEAFTSLNSILKDSDKYLDDIQAYVSKLTARRPDVFKPIEYAIDNEIDVDVFIVLSSSNDFTNRYNENMLNKYRQVMNRPYAKLVVCAMGSHDFTFADPNDPGMFDVCGFDDCVPNYFMKITNALK